METERQSNEIELGGGKKVIHVARLRSSVAARFREMNPKTLEFLVSLVGTPGEETVTYRIHKGAMAGFPTSEVLNMCTFLAEITRDVQGFGDRYDWPSMTVEQKADFFDLEFTDAERLAYTATAFVKLIVGNL